MAEADTMDEWEEDLSIEIQVLRENQKWILPHITASNIIDCFPDGATFTTADRQEIDCRQTNMGSIAAARLFLLKLVTKRDWFQNFIIALCDKEHKGHYEEICRALTEGVAERTIKQEQQVKESQKIDVCDYQESAETLVEGGLKTQNKGKCSNLDVANNLKRGIYNIRKDAKINTVTNNLANCSPLTQKCANRPVQETRSSNANTVPKTYHNQTAVSDHPQATELGTPLDQDRKTPQYIPVNSLTEPDFRSSSLVFGDIPHLKSSQDGHSLAPTNEHTEPKLGWTCEDKADDVIVEEELIEVMTVNDSGDLYGNRGESRKPLKPLSFTPKEYQKELARRPMEKQNCIICAPTNSGKTYVAIMIAHDHLEKVEIEIQQEASAINDTQKPCVVVVVPRFALLQQVFRDFRQHMPLANIGKRSGASPSKRSIAVLLQEHDVVILTADILKNGLRDNIVRVQDISLLIFDECHHTKDDHPYNDIMERYVEEKYRQPGTVLPQVVGLTASPGAGKRCSADLARASILRLCANLDADAFVTVQENQEELRQWTTRPERFRVKTDVRSSNPVIQALSVWMDELEKLSSLGAPPSKGTQQYESFVVESKTKKLSLQNFDDVTVCESLIALNNALIMCSTVRLSDGWKMVEDFYQPFTSRQQEGKLSSVEATLLKQFQNNKERIKDVLKNEGQYPNPKLEALRHVILTHRDRCRRKDMDLRVMIFVKTRQITMALLEWMRSDKILEDLNPTYFTGVRAESERGGMSSQQQRTVLVHFAEGVHKVLVSTSVGEEGIDIPACSLSVRYDHVTNEISMIQARGRVRQQAGNEVIIGQSETMEKDSYNVMLEKAMIEAMSSITVTSPTQLKQETSNIQREAVLEREEKIRQRQVREGADNAADVQLKCKNCRIFVCPANDIRIFKNTNHILPHPKYKELVELKDHPDPEKSRKYNIKKIHCKECGSDWGNTAGGWNYYPCLAVTSFIFIIDGEVKTFKQWKKVPFAIQKFEK